MDTFSDVLSSLNPKSLLSATLEAGGVWSVRFAGFNGIKINVVVRGECWLLLHDTAVPIALKVGDCFMLTDGKPFVMCSSPELDPTEARSLYARAEDGVARCGEERTFTAIGGRVEIDEWDTPLLPQALPPVVLVDGQSEQAAGLRWMLQRFSNELSEGGPGAALVTQHLTQLMLVDLLRIYLAGQEPQVEWIGALSDRRISVAIRLMHAQPARRWTVLELALASSMSRSNFSLQFKRLVGVAPLEYLLRWRMRLAARQLQHGVQAISSLAYSLGYASESAFSNAFKRVFGSAPAIYRAQAQPERRDSKVPGQARGAESAL
jgi:AraC-like DNA-binding protein